MGGFSLVHWLIVAFVVLLLFGRGRISEIMGDFGKGIKSFKQGINEEENAPPAKITAPDASPTTVVTEKSTTGNS